MFCSCQVLGTPKEKKKRKCTIFIQCQWVLHLKEVIFFSARGQMDREDQSNTKIVWILSYLGRGEHTMANVFKPEFGGFDFFVCAHGSKSSRDLEEAPFSGSERCLDSFASFSWGLPVFW